MDCRSFQDRLDDFLDGRLPDADRRTAKKHVRDCARCREMVEILRSASDTPPVEPPSDLTRAILERTSGSPCESSRALLCDFVDGALTGVDADLVRLHLGDCPECTALGHALTRLADELPELAEIEPDPGFVDAVVARTVPWRRRVARRLPALADLGARLARRPRFALEAAYVGTVILVLAVGPNALARVPDWAIGVVQARPVLASDRTTDVRDRVASGLNGLWNATGGRAAEISREARGDLATRYERTDDVRSDLRRHRGELVKAVHATNPSEAVTALKGIVSDLGTLSRRFASDETDEDENPER
ncbi:MAG: anti-sigma factor family protein [Planctomycetota bacterium]|jgi:anti-sigma factor RsiW